MNCVGSQNNHNEVEKQLKDALEKNQQWLLYDQQREAYVRGLLGRIFELEQQSETVNQQQTTEASAEGYLQEEKQKYYDRLLVTAKNDLETERQTVAQLSSELNEFKRKYEETVLEVMHLNSLLQSQQPVDMHVMQDENKIKVEVIQKLKHENEVTREKLKEERKRTEDLLSQIQLLHKTLLKQQEEHTRIALLEQQKLQELGHVEPSHSFQTVFEDKLTIHDPHCSPKHSNLLDESFLECPKCKMQYPTSQHRELLAHIDFCPD
uniref:Centrosomal protein of 55 kDa n=1 Tax=Sphenodon punctatus TaxID=8508 RepID=A0A8D0L297_SPHPU